MLTQAIMFEIWQSRNNNKYDKTLLTHKTITNKINAELKNILQIQYKKHKLNDPLDLFQEYFFINNAIAKLVNKQLEILLT